jgi:hypothetical protein
MELEPKKCEKKRQADEAAERIRRVECSLFHDRSFLHASNPSHTVDAVQKQLEFYFGDANLSKDAYLRKVMHGHKKGYVELGELLKFDRLKKLFEHSHVSGFEERLNIMRQAIKKSGLLRACKEGKRVKRCVPFDEKLLADRAWLEDVDSRTVYVENIPTFATREMLAEVFKKCGKILFVSLPLDAVTKKNRGYAFIEFEVAANQQTVDCAIASLALNNSIPKQFMLEHSHEEMVAMRIISKPEWSRLKEEYKKVPAAHRDAH